jgi:glyoxylate reductase
MDKPYVFITRKLPSQFIEPLSEIARIEMWDDEEQPVPHQLLAEKAKEATALLTMLSDRIDTSVMEGAKHLKIIANLAVGYDNVSVDEATKRGITVCNTPDVLSDTTADLTFGLLMAAARRITEAAAYVKQGEWKGWSPYLLAGQDIHHKTIGIVGMGKIGCAVARRASGFDMDILYHNRSRHMETEKKLGAEYCSFDDLITRADYIVCLTPLTNETRHLFNEAAFRKMKSSAIFINASRGAVVDEEALFRALKEGEIAGAGLDVFTKEPIDSQHPLLSLNNVIALPHIGSSSVETRTAMIKLCIENILLSLKQQQPKTVINTPDIIRFS